MLGIPSIITTQIYTFCSKRTSLDQECVTGINKYIRGRGAYNIHHDKRTILSFCFAELIRVLRGEIMMS